MVKVLEEKGIRVKDWQIPHYKIIKDFLLYLNKHSNKFILKGGTALMLCYDLNRFSEDIDLDSLDGRGFVLKNHVEAFCKLFNYSFRVAKNTLTTFRIFINYGNNLNGAHPLKIEVSMRNAEIIKSDFHIADGILVYKIPKIAEQKIMAYSLRDTTRDLFDVTFLILNYYSTFSHDLKNYMKNVISRKGLEQLDFLILSYGKDELIAYDLLTEDFLKMWELLEEPDDNIEYPKSMEEFGTWARDRTVEQVINALEILGVYKSRE